MVYAWPPRCYFCSKKAKYWGMISVRIGRKYVCEKHKGRVRACVWEKRGRGRRSEWFLRRIRCRERLGRDEVVALVAFVLYTLVLIIIGSVLLGVAEV